ncbi:uncharacterized protein MONBRDRAFT_10647 [Monosiga brevicollis MX1]|uniref:Glucose/Sorbosone dehydrogenase domain-containing protein n=1 Tax=Monosiga brevicollis TaxID=81824 RepID=A9V6J2_MONBE|nr:uncharacterized protein MONBRDRAFT_10647 [Monosiga brevicollis MX1]EDQ86894.1 predicted protein [Monosiga brevicollis MX1]|eukprot:XP_001748439.1 hypothetical protein [Monosiga brevicollis MX1]
MAAALWLCILLLANTVPCTEAQLGHVQREPLLTLDQEPVKLRFLPDGRLLVLERLGRLTLLNTSSLEAATYAQFDTSRLMQGVEYGLFDFALSPEFETDQQIFLYWSPRQPEQLRISVFTHEENDGGLSSRLDLASEITIWTEPETGYNNACCHFGAGLDFGPDGKLYVAVGDMFQGNVAQNPTSARGKLLRLNADGSIPSDNWGAQMGGTFYAGIQAMGLRNPFSGRWDPVSGLYVMAEVGGNDQAISTEDVHVYDPTKMAGANYGWPMCEGMCNDTRFPTCDCLLHESALYAVPHDGYGMAIVGGLVYRGSMFPSHYDGAIIIGDYVSGWIKVLETTWSPEPTVVESTTMAQFQGNLLSLAEGPDGAIYATDMAGHVFRYMYYDGNRPPVLHNVQYQAFWPEAPVTITLTANASDPEESPLSYNWYMEGQVIPWAVGQSATLSLTQAGRYAVAVVISDGHMTTRSHSLPLTVGAPPALELASPLNNSVFSAGNRLDLIATSATPNATLAWSVRFRHDQHFHPTMAWTEGAQLEFNAPVRGHSFGGQTGYLIEARATDAHGLMTLQHVNIWPRKAAIVFASNPSGAMLLVDGIPHALPYTLDTLVGFQHELRLEPAYCRAGVRYVLSEWNVSLTALSALPNAGTLVVAPDAATYMAVFQPSGACDEHLPTHGLVLHVVAAENVTTDESGQVSLWTDLSGYNNTLAPLMGHGPQLVQRSSTPAHGPAQFLQFDGAGAELGAEAFAAQPTTSFTVVVAVRYWSAGWGGLTFGQPACYQVAGAAVSPAGNLMVETYCSGDGSESAWQGQGQPWLLHTVVADGTTNRMLVNGSTVSSFLVGWNLQPGALMMGVEHARTNSVRMDVAEALVYDRALGVEELAAVHAILMNRHFNVSEAPTVVAQFTSPAGPDSTLARDTAVTWRWSTNVNVGTQQAAMELDGVEQYALDLAERTTQSWSLPAGLAPGPHTLTLLVQVAGGTGVERVQSTSFVLETTGMSTESAASTTPAVSSTEQVSQVILHQPNPLIPVVSNIVEIEWDTMLDENQYVMTIVKLGDLEVEVAQLSGVYQFTNVAPGEYDVFVAVMRSTGAPLMARTVVEVISAPLETTQEPSSNAGTTTAPLSSSTPDAHIEWMTELAANVSADFPRDGYRVQFAGAWPGVPAGIAMRFATALDQPSSKAFFSRRMTLDSCFTECDRDPYCRAVHYWRTSTDEYCSGLLDQDLGTSVETTQTSLGFVKAATTVAAPQLCAYGREMGTGALSAGCDCGGNCQTRADAAERVALVLCLFESGWAVSSGSDPSIQPYMMPYSEEFDHILQLRDYRLVSCHTDLWAEHGAIFPDVRVVQLAPSQQGRLADIHLIKATHPKHAALDWSDDDFVAVEAALVQRLAPPQCLDLDTNPDVFHDRTLDYVNRHPARLLNKPWADDDDDIRRHRADELRRCDKMKRIRLMQFEPRATHCLRPSLASTRHVLADDPFFAGQCIPDLGMLCPRHPQAMPCTMTHRCWAGHLNLDDPETMQVRRPVENAKSHQLVCYGQIVEVRRIEGERPWQVCVRDSWDLPFEPRLCTNFGSLDEANAFCREQQLFLEQIEGRPLKHDIWATLQGTELKEVPNPVPTEAPSLLTPKVPRPVSPEQARPLNSSNRHSNNSFGSNANSNCSNNRKASSSNNSNSSTNSNSNSNNSNNNNFNSNERSIKRRPLLNEIPYRFVRSSIPATVLYGLEI